MSDPLRLLMPQICEIGVVPRDEVWSPVGLTMSDEERRAAAQLLQQALAQLEKVGGLTVAEAMWKARPVLASDVGGIRDQIEDGRSGVLLPDPTDLEGFAGRLRDLLDDPATAARLGAAAHERVRGHFLPVRHLSQYTDLIEHCMAGD